ncbi:YkuS family protein [Phosphitispora sp. TUW77]|uniref:YkuS family protein n=1 Tax=Phosphitispora sp. TUW77 TaxID=3152361 RepID=UPI003AB7701E
MPLTVAVQNGLLDIAAAVGEQGYNVVRMEDDIGPVDVIVYSGVSNDLTLFDTVDYYGDATTMGVSNPSGIMLVNAHSHSPEQVVSLINKRFGRLEG